MGARQIKQFCRVADDVKDLLRAAISQLGLSARAYDRILKLARTIADLDNQEEIALAHVGRSHPVPGIGSETVGMKMQNADAGFPCRRFLTLVRLAPIDCIQQCKGRDDWSTLGIAGTERFSGTACYRTSFEAPTAIDDDGGWTWAKSVKAPTSASTAMQ